MILREYGVSNNLLHRVWRKFIPCFGRRTLKFKLDKPIVSISFDDFPKSVMENALPILDKYDWKASFYSCAGLEGITNHLGLHYDRNDLIKLRHEGHEIGCHTYHHLNVAELSERRAAEQIRANSKAMKAIGHHESMDTFAYPFGETSIGRKKQLETYFASLRGIMPGIHYGKVDLNQIKSVPIYSGPSLARTAKYIEKLKDKPGWLTLFTHDVRENPSQWGCTPEDFAYILGLIHETGAIVVPIQKTVKLLEENATRAYKMKSSLCTAGQTRGNNNMDTGDAITVIIPTYKRPKGLEIALSNLITEDVNSDLFEIIVSDNDPAGGARDYVEKIAAQQTKPEIIYVHATEPGVCNARNTAMEKARGRFLVFVDDDMETSHGWVQKMVDLLLKYKAGIAFSDVTARMHDPQDPALQAMIPVFSRTMDEPEGLIEKFLGMGGAALDTSLMTLPHPPFNPDLNDVGGEDDFLFHQLKNQGVKTAWSPHFSAIEIIPKSRATLKYIWKRNFAFGQGPTQTAADRGIMGVPKVIYWMMVGCAQALVFGLQYVAYRLLGRNDAVQRFARLSQGVGKIFWWDGFRPRLYGAKSTTE